MKAVKIWLYGKLYRFFYQRYEPLIRVANGRTSKKGNWIKVSDHALHRYLERVRHIDLEECHDALLSENLRERVQRLGQGDYEIDDFRVRVINNTIVTVLDGTTATSYRPTKRKAES